MHLYWKVIEELKFLGESVVFHDPSLLREYKRWVEKNVYELLLSYGFDVEKIPLLSLN